MAINLNYSGNTVYHLAATLNSMANPMMAFLAMFLPCKSRKIVTFLTGHKWFLALEREREILHNSVRMSVCLYVHCSEYFLLLFASKELHSKLYFCQYLLFIILSESQRTSIWDCLLQCWAAWLQCTLLQQLCTRRPPCGAMLAVSSLSLAGSQSARCFLMSR